MGKGKEKKNPQKSKKNNKKINKKNKKNGIGALEAEARAEARIG